MPRNYIKKTSGPKYTQNDLQMAIAEVKNGASIYSASKKNGIPEQTLRRWIVKSPSHQGPGRSPFLSQEEEKCIVEAVKFLSKCGFPFDRKDILNVVETYLLSNKKLSNLFPNGKPGIEWVRGFEKRWKGEIGKRKPELLTKARAKDMCEESANAFFNIYENVLLSNGLLKEPGRIFNLDETGLSTDPRSSKIFVPKESRTAYLKSADCGKAMYTVLFCISAAGEYLPPFVVYKGQNLYQSWMTGGPQGTLYGCTESGWMQDFLFETWMKFFIDFIKNFKKPVLLIYDGHGSHLTYNSIKLAMDNGIILLCLPPNSSHALQPLDVGVFSPMKNAWRDVLKTWYRESRLQNVSKATFPFLLKKLFEKMKATNAVNGFRGTGLYPLNRNAIQHRIIPTEKNPTVAATNKSSASSKVSALVLDSPMKDLKEAILLTVSPTPSANTVLAMDNSKKKRKRVQSKSGEILTQENVLKRLAMEEEDRKKKCNLGQVPKRKDQKRSDIKIKKVTSPTTPLDTRKINQGSWLEVKYNSKRNMMCSFIGQVVEKNGDLYHVKYLTKSKLGNYYIFPELDDEDNVEVSSIIRILDEPRFDSRGHYFFNH